MVAQGLARAHLTQDDDGAEPSRDSLQVVDVLHDARIGNDNVQLQVRCVLIEDAQMIGGGHPVRLPALGRQVEHDRLEGPGALQGPPHGGQDQVGQDRCVPGAGPQNHPVRLVDGLHGLGVCVRIGGDDAHVLHLAALGGHGHLTAHSPAVGAVDDVRLDDQGRGAHGDHPSVDRQEPPDPVQALDLIAEKLPQREDEQVAQGVVIELALAGETVLEHIAPGQPPLGVVGQRGQGHAQVPGRQAVELPPQASGGPAVVGHGDHGSELMGDMAQRPQGGG